MKSSCDKTFTLTTSLVIARSVAEKQQNDVLTKACTVQSALGISLVRSVECGLFAQLAFGFFAKKSVFYQ